MRIDCTNCKGAGIETTPWGQSYACRTCKGVGLIEELEGAMRVIAEWLTIDFEDLTTEDMLDEGLALIDYLAEEGFLVVPTTEVAALRERRCD